MSIADVRNHEAECSTTMICNDQVALSDGKYSGPCLGSELSEGNYLGCLDVEEIFIMTDDGR